MKPPFNLIRVFSLASLTTTVVLTFCLGWLLSQNLENQLLERDRQFTERTVSTEITEELIEMELLFNEAHLNETFIEEMNEFKDEIYGATSLEMIHLSGEVLWSTNPQSIGTTRMDLLFQQARQGKTIIDLQEVEMESSIGYLSSMAVPIMMGGNLVGVFELQRQEQELYLQIENVKETVYLYCSLFGVVLYFMMLLIVIPAAKTLNKQHQQLIEAKEQLIQSERLSAIGEVCGAVAHGLKNPIASVRAAVQLLGVRNVSEERRTKITADILHEVDRLTKRLQDLLNFIRPFDPDFQNVTLQDVLNNAARSLYWKAEKENIHFKIDESPDLVNVRIDAALMEEAVLIVLSNAMEASKSGDTIHCSIEKQADSHAIVIQDQGKGIPTELSAKVFEQFFTTHSKGVGLGLPLCRKIMGLHQGEVSISSEVDLGTTVRLVLPQFA